MNHQFSNIKTNVYDVRVSVCLFGHSVSNDAFIVSNGHNCTTLYTTV